MGLIVSGGGQTYDRTTGTWAGENQGNVGDGDYRAVDERAGIVWHDANGPLGVQLWNPGTVGGEAQGPAAQMVSNGGTGPGSAGVGATSAGPGAPGTGGTGGRGAGSSLVVQGPRGTGPLKQKPNMSVTQVYAGGDWWQSNPWFSDAEEWTTRYGEGELAETFFFLTTSVADLTWNTMRTGKPLADNVVDPTVNAVSDWLSEASARRSGPMPKQEPVDWGR